MVDHVKVTVLVEGEGDHPTLKGTSMPKKLRPLVGLSLYVEVKRNSETSRILMDTGTSWSRLEHNASVLGKDLRGIDCGFITHWHFDHTGALPALLRSMTEQPRFYVPVREPSLSLINGFVESRLPPGINRVEVDKPREILPGVYSTGCLEGAFPLQRYPVHEQALYMHVEGKGLVVFVGCSHPKPQDIAKRAVELSGEERIALMLGGFHFIPPTKAPQIAETIREFKGMDIERIAACHCTGAQGMDRMEAEFGDRFLRVELGGTYEVRK